MAVSFAGVLRLDISAAYYNRILDFFYNMDFAMEVFSAKALWTSQSILLPFEPVGGSACCWGIQRRWSCK